jgi:hypothetical protein
MCHVDAMTHCSQLNNCIRTRRTCIIGPWYSCNYVCIPLLAMIVCRILYPYCTVCHRRTSVVKTLMQVYRPHFFNRFKGSMVTITLLHISCVSTNPIDKLQEATGFTIVFLFSPLSCGLCCRADCRSRSAQGL